MSAAVSESMMRRLASEKNRSASTAGFETFSFTTGRWMRPIGPAPKAVIGRSSRRAPVRPLRMLKL